MGVLREGETWGPLEGDRCRVSSSDTSVYSYHYWCVVLPTEPFEEAT